MQMSIHLEHLVWKGQPLGGFIALGTSPSRTDSVECTRCEMILLGPPRDEAIYGLSGLLLAAKGQAWDLHVPGARTQAMQP